MAVRIYVFRKVTTREALSTAQSPNPNGAMTREASFLEGIPPPKTNEKCIDASIALCRSFNL